MNHRQWVVNVPGTRQYVTMHGADRVSLDTILPCVFPWPPRRMPDGSRYTDSDDEDDVATFLDPNSENSSVGLPPRPPKPAIWTTLQNSYRDELMRTKQSYGTRDWEIPLGDIYVFIKERLSTDDEALLAQLDGYNFNALAEAAHVKWRLMLLDEVHKCKKRKRDLDAALDAVTYSAPFIKRARGDKRPIPSGLE